VGDPDVVIAGGGPAGLATALRARLAGLEVVVLEAAGPEIDKACGEGLMPDGAEVLAGLGVDLEGLETRAFRGIRYTDGDVIAEGRFPGAPGLGIRRTVLHRALSRRATEIGVDLRWGTRVAALADGGFATDDGVVRGRWLVGADGRTSRVRKWAGLDGRRATRRRLGLRRHYAVAPWTDLVEVNWHDRCEAYVTPVGEELIGVAMLFEGGPSDFDALLARFPKLQGRLAGAPIASTDRGAGPLEQRCRRVTRDNIILVGDAAGYLDAITGEGLALAFRQAEAAVAAMLDGRLARYASAHQRIVRYPTAVTRLLLEVERRPGLRRRVILSLARDPSLMSRFLELKMRRDGPRLLGSGGLVPLSLAVLKG
jgi:flavin-dependent dehydrogenase